MDLNAKIKGSQKKGFTVYIFDLLPILCERVLAMAVDVFGYVQMDLTKFSWKRLSAEYERYIELPVQT